jgi:hypothetical protein
MRSDRSARLILLFFLFLLWFNYPILSIFDRQELWGGLPSLYLYLFLTWLLFIVSIVRIVQSGGKKRIG